MYVPASRLESWPKSPRSPRLWRTTTVLNVADTLFTPSGAAASTPPAEPKEPGIHKTAGDRRRIAIRALGTQLDGHASDSAASRLRHLIDGPPRPMIISGDIDGLVSAAMLASVAPGWEVVAIVCQSQTILMHPSLSDRPRPGDLFGVDLFSIQCDNVSNHVVEFGPKKLQLLPVREAFQAWDAQIALASRERLLAVPAIWASTKACYEDADKPDSSKYKYPLGTAQILLALLEAAGRPPRFYDRQYLPWLIANCDGGVSSYSKYAFNAAVWWPTLAGAVGPASLSEQVYQRVATMRPHDFIDAVNRLDRERQASGFPAWLNDDWNLVNQSVPTLARTLTWLSQLTGWDDCVRGGSSSLSSWKSVVIPPEESGQVYLSGGQSAKTKADPEAAAASIRAAGEAINANFYFGGFSGSRFNWVGGWPSV